MDRRRYMRALYQVVAEASDGGCIAIVTEVICSSPVWRYFGIYMSIIDVYVIVDA